jgi:5'-3' exonuclease
VVTLMAKKMTQTSSDQEPKIALVDADFLVYRIGFSTDDEPEGIAKARLTEWLEDFIYVNLKADEYKAWITGKSNYRYDIAKTVPYKGNRKDVLRPKHYDALRKHLVKRHEAIISDGEEADDAVAIESTKLLDNCWIVHVDKDLDQLQGWHYNPVRDERYYVDEFTAYKAFCTQLLTGDRIDNIPCLDGIGPKKAAKALAEAKTKEELIQAAFDKYQELGYSAEYFREQGQLLWLRRYEGELWQPPSKLQPSTDSVADSKSE